MTGMTIDSDILLTFGLLALAVLLLWIPVPALGGTRAWGWGGALGLACLAALAGGLLDWRALAAVALYVALARGARAASRAWLRRTLLALTGCMALLLALHRVPGFHNPVLAEGIRFSPDALPFSLRANVDTAVAGIVLMGMLCAPMATRAQWAAMLRRAAPVMLGTVAVVLGLGLALGHVRPDLKWTPYSAWFLAYNLLVTCVTEEAFFRGLLLAGMARALRAWRGGAAAAAAVSSLLFGLAHLGGGPQLALLATLAGLGYAAAFLRTRRIEGAILTHFAVNAVHFVALSYPALAP